jgi:hypothetical protein
MEMIKFMNTLDDDLAKSGELVYEEGLADPSQVSGGQSLGDLVAGTMRETPAGDGRGLRRSVILSIPINTRDVYARSGRSGTLSAEGDRQPSHFDIKTRGLVPSSSQSSHYRCRALWTTARATSCNLRLWLRA